MDGRGEQRPSAGRHQLPAGARMASILLFNHGLQGAGPLRLNYMVGTAQWAGLPAPHSAAAACLTRTTTFPRACPCSTNSIASLQAALWPASTRLKLDRAGAYNLPAPAAPLHQIPGS